jgi:uncharacterized protein
VTILLDGSLLVALLTDDHVHHGPAERWLNADTRRFATCPITQGAVVRLAVQRGHAPTSALGPLRSLVSSDRHEFWPADIDYLGVRLDGVIGHRQVTDAYLAALARARNGRVATLDKGLAALHGDVAERVPIEPS